MKLNKILLNLCIFILLLNFVSAYITTYYCYQESANVSNQTGIDGNCNLNYTGNYTFSTGTSNPRRWINTSLLIDGDYNTYSEVDSDDYNQYSYMYAYYNLPNNDVNDILIRTKQSLGDTITPEIIDTNYSIQNSCYNNAISTNILTFRLESNDNAFTSITSLYCYNGSDWVYIISGNGGTRIYDESVIWNVNITITFYLTINNNISNNVYTNTNLSFNVTPTDLLYNYSNLTTKWYKNNINIYNETKLNILNNTLTEFILSSDNFSKNDIINASVIGFNGIENSSIVYTNTVTILNTAPTTPEVLSLTQSPNVGDTITMVCENSTDIDGDNISYYYEFYNNFDSMIVQSYSLNDSYIVQQTDADETLTGRCKAYDGTDYSSVNTTTTTVQTWYELKLDLDYLDNFGIWFYASYNCSYNYWKLEAPIYSFRACCKNCDVCSAEN